MKFKKNYFLFRLYVETHPNKKLIDSGNFSPGIRYDSEFMLIKKLQVKPTATKIWHRTKLIMCQYPKIWAYMHDSVFFTTDVLRLES